MLLAWERNPKGTPPQPLKQAPGRALGLAAGVGQHWGRPCVLCRARLGATAALHLSHRLPWPRLKAVKCGMLRGTVLSSN